MNEIVTFDSDQFDDVAVMEEALVVDDTPLVEAVELPLYAASLIAEVEYLNQFYFPVCERTVYTRNVIGPEANLIGNLDYKAICKADSNKVISIMKKGYKVVENKKVIQTVMEQLTKLNTPFHVNKSHSFIEDNRMKLQIVFPDLRLQDGNSEIPLSVYIHNSYDGSEGVRLFWGAIRAICVNGMIFGKLMGKYYHKHTRNMSFGDIGKQLSKAVEALPQIQNRIEQLDSINLTDNIMTDIEKKLGKTIHKHLTNNLGRFATQWDLYNAITYYISHTVSQKMRTYYQLQLSKVFEL